MSNELIGFLYELAVDRVAKPALNGNGDGFIHLVAVTTPTRCFLRFLFSIFKNVV